MSAPTFSVTLNSQLNIVETLTGVGVSSTDNTVTLNGLNETVVLTASTTPAVTKATEFSKAMSVGAATIDLTLLPGLTDSETIDGTGLKVNGLKLMNPVANTGKIVVSQGASNAYRLDASTSTWSIPLKPGQSCLLWLDGQADTVASGRKAIDLAGTGSETLTVGVILG